MIGDPTGQSETRVALSKQKVLENAKTYERQIFKILDPAKTLVEFNSRWMSTMTAEALIHLSCALSVSLACWSGTIFISVTQEQKPISIHEFMYPLVQGYDSVAFKSDVELGGTDQKFNLLVGRELQRDHGQEPQVVITMPLLEGTDGVKKMSKSVGNYMALEDVSGRHVRQAHVDQRFDLMLRYYELLTTEDLARSQRGASDGSQTATGGSARRAVSRTEAAEAPLQGFSRKFQTGSFPIVPDTVVQLQRDGYDRA